MVILEPALKSGHPPSKQNTNVDISLVFGPKRRPVGAEASPPSLQTVSPSRLVSRGYQLSRHLSRPLCQVHVCSHPLWVIACACVHLGYPAPGKCCQSRGDRHCPLAWNSLIRQFWSLWMAMKITFPVKRTFCCFSIFFLYVYRQG